jgi:hypothetical protein
VFADDDSAPFREALLAESIRLTRGARRWRQARGVTALCLVVGLTLVLAHRNPSFVAPIKPNPTAQTVPPSFRLVPTRPLPAANIVATQPLATHDLVSGASALHVIQTSPGGFHVINDAQLLSLLSPHPCGLVRLGPASEMLVFSHPNDAKGFPVN